MPKAQEEQLKRNVNARHPDWSKERKDAYVYGTLNKVKRRHMLKVARKKHRMVRKKKR